MAYNQHFMDLVDEETKIINENPYNWRKHLLFNLPDLFYFILKCGVLFTVFYLWVGAFTAQMIAELPRFCSLIK